MTFAAHGKKVKQADQRREYDRQTATTIKPMTTNRYTEIDPRGPEFLPLCKTVPARQRKGDRRVFSRPTVNGQSAAVGGSRKPKKRAVKGRNLHKTRPCRDRFRARTNSEQHSSSSSPRLIPAGSTSSPSFHTNRHYIRIISKMRRFLLYTWASCSMFHIV